ncbi:hypothetical protein CPAR01_15179 [Colletotrichum paranaense]|uniref:Uncharacterized protein n=1 Tax=Colletotrichum paranaense TaxID=1914294 RepID=A0ABQ9RZN3_9PEZI|nr:uncharacterized protein CPAR01_15179 [Colletotrichum paranaense]KAK1520128.1 hypothetical protein CPAR01_15179 [Colletotrichum paranaense]
MGQTESDCEWGSGYPRCNAMRYLSMPTHSALRCVVNCGLRTAYCTWRLANARFVRAPVSGISVRTDWTGRDVRFGTKEVVEVSKSSKARASRIPMVIPSHPVSFSLSLISSNSPSHPSLRSIHKYQQLPHHTFFSQLTLSLATFAFDTFWCSSDLALGTRDISYRFSQQTGIPIDCRRKVWPCRGLVRRLVVHDPSGRHAWTPWTLDLVFLAVFWPRAAGHSLVPDAAKKDLALSVGHPHFACLRFFSQNVRGIHLPYPRAVLLVLPLPILSRYGSCHPS